MTALEQAVHHRDTEEAMSQLGALVPTFTREPSSARTTGFRARVAL
jgi:hypothetical protein